MKTHAELLAVHPGLTVSRLVNDPANAHLTELTEP